VTDIALKLRCSPSQVVLSWLLKQGLYVIPRSSNTEHLKCNLELQGVDWQMSEPKKLVVECEEKLQKTNEELFNNKIDISIDAEINSQHAKCNLESKEVNWHLNEVEEHDCEEKMLKLRKSNDEEFAFMIDISQEAYFQQIHWGNECIMQPFTLVL
jgi:hypothetical protein